MKYKNNRENETTSWQINKIEKNQGESINKIIRKIIN